MNVYDFDKTIYNGDSTVDFYKYCVKNKPSILFCFPIFTAIGFLLGFVPKLRFKEKFYRFLTKLSDVDASVESFWDKNISNIKQWYKDRQRDDDLIISASPEFLLRPAMSRLGIGHMMASVVDKHTGRYTGENCHGEEKVRRFYESYGEFKIDEFYSDSLSDTPLADISKEPYIIIGEAVTPWAEYKISALKKIIKTFLSPEFILFVLIGVINTVNCIWLSVVWEFIIKDPNLAFVGGYAMSLLIAYVLNSKVNFKRKLSFITLIKFAISYIPNFIIQNVIVFITYNILGIPSIIAYCLAAVIGLPITFLCVKLFAFAKRETK